MGFNQNPFISPLFKLFGKKLANVPPSPVNNDIIQFNSTSNEWELISGVIGNAVQSSSNVGTGAGLALPRVLDDLPFKTLVDGVEIVITVSATELTFSIGAIAISKITGLQVALDTKIETITNVGGASEIALAKVGQNVNLRTLLANLEILITTNANDLAFSIGAIAQSKITGLVTALASKIETLTNVGTGVGKIAKAKVGTNVDLKSILAGTGITVNNLTDEIEIVNSQPPEVGNRKLFSEFRQVSVFPTDNNNLGFIMIGAGNFTDEGDMTQFFDTDGYYIEFRVTVDMGAGDGGFFCIDALRREHNFDITIKFRVPATLDRRFWAGVFTADPSGADNPIAEHIALRLSTSATNVNFVLSHADGVTQAETQLALADTAIHTIRILADESNSKFQYSFDGGALVDVTTNIPASTTDLDIFSEIFALAGGTLPHYDFWYLDGVSDK